MRRVVSWFIFSLILLVSVSAKAAMLNIGWIGDSITQSADGDIAQGRACADLTAAGNTVTCINRGIAGTGTGNWLSGSSNLVAAKAAFAAAGVSIVHILLGTNDAATTDRGGANLTPSQHLTNMTSIVNDLVASGYKVIISKPLYIVPYSFAWDDDPNPTLQSYFIADLSLVDGRTVLPGDTAGFDQSAANPSVFLNSDGVHPSPAGATMLGGDWAAAVARSLGSI